MCFYLWKNIEASFPGSRGMWQPQHSSSSTHSHSGTLWWNCRAQVKSLLQHHVALGRAWPGLLPVWEDDPAEGQGSVLTHQHRGCTLKSQLSAPDFQVSPKYQVDLTLLCLQDSTEKKNQNKAGND